MNKFKNHIFRKGTGMLIGVNLSLFGLSVGFLTRPELKFFGFYQKSTEVD